VNVLADEILQILASRQPVVRVSDFDDAGNGTDARRGEGLHDPANGIGLKHRVGIQDDEILGLNIAQCRVRSRPLARIFLPHQQHALIGCGDGRDDLGGIVLRSIIDNDHPHVRVIAGKARADAGFDDLPFVVGGNHDSDRRCPVGVDGVARTPQMREDQESRGPEDCH